MLKQNSFFSKYPRLEEGALVYDRDGEKLGKITSLSDDYFMVQKGIFFPKDFTFRYDDVEDVREGNAYLNLSKAELEPWRSESYEGWSQVDDINAGRTRAEPLPEYSDNPDYQERFGRVSREETRVPVVEEDLEARRKLQQTGEVTVRKVVHTELRHLTIPVMKEEVRVERVPVREGEQRAAATGDAAFQESTVKVPVMEEEVEVVKRPVVREEVRISKERRTESRDVSENVKRENVEVDEQGTTKKRKAG